MYTPKLSFIIPAFNEEANIASTIKHIKMHAPSDIEYEIIVVDHGSTDSTAELARKNSALVFSVQGGTIAGLRNHGVKNSSGDILIFLDADILLTQEWADNVTDVIRKYQNGERILTGSQYSIPNNPNWIERYWFQSLQKMNNKYINSGHMIISRVLFDELSGFDETLETGEDYDISMRARNKNITIIDNHSLKVIHAGYPAGLWEFVLREFWHGKGDATSLGMILSSKIASLSIVFILLHTILATSLIFSDLNSYTVYASILGILVIPVGMSYNKFKTKSIKILLINSFIYYFYLFSRGLSSIIGPFRNKVKKRHR
jgi:glycosyltransferase involved in cell wall biosynthesis